jgi:hypothetical protein
VRCDCAASSCCSAAFRCASCMCFPPNGPVDVVVPTCTRCAALLPIRPRGLFCDPLSTTRTLTKHGHLTRCGQSRSVGGTRPETDSAWNPEWEIDPLGRNNTDKPRPTILRLMSEQTLRSRLRERGLLVSTDLGRQMLTIVVRYAAVPADGGQAGGVGPLRAGGALPSTANRYAPGSAPDDIRSALHEGTLAEGWTAAGAEAPSAPHK